VLAIASKKVYYLFTTEAWRYRLHRWRFNFGTHVRFERKPFLRDVDLGDLKVGRYLCVRVTNPSDTRSARRIGVLLVRLERSIDGAYQELPLGSPPRLLRWVNQEHATDKGWGARDIPQCLYNDVNVITVTQERVHIEWEGPAYLTDPTIVEPGA